MRNTVNVNTILDRANAFFQNSSDEAVEGRKALATFVSGLLCEAGNYNGYVFLTTESNPQKGNWGESARIFFL